MDNIDKKQTSRNKIIFLLDYKYFAIILIMVPLYLFNNIIIKGIGYLAIVSIFLFALNDLIIKGSRKKVTEVWIWYIIILIYNVILVARNVSKGSIYAFLLQSLLLLFIVQLSSINLDKIALERITKYGKLLFAIILIPSIFVIIKGGDQAIRLFNGTFNFVMYKFMFPCTFFFLINNKHIFIKTVSFALFFILMTERTIAITMVIIYFVYIILGRLKRSRISYNALLVCVFIGVIGFTYLYINLQYTNIGQYINQVFRTYTGGNFFSGRNNIWESAYRYIVDAKFFGYGLKSDVMTLPGIDKSVHNTYLYILIQGGIVGLLSFFFFISSLWKRLYRYLDNHIIRLSASYLIGILVYINFEVSLIGNTVGPGIFMWLVIGIGLIHNNNQRLKT